MNREDGSSDLSHGASPGGFDTRAIHYGYDASRYDNALQPPVFLTSTYAFPSVEANERASAEGAPLYGREHNTTTQLLERRLASLEGAEDGLVLASGMAAFGTLTLSLLSQGDEVVVHQTLYLNTLRMVSEGLPRFGIKVVPVDLSDPANLDDAITGRTKLVYFETPVNPMAAILDIAAITQRAHARGVRVAVDSTFASPALQRPMEHGADIVLHSLTKYISGHGDALGGALLADAETVHQLRMTGLNYITGATPSPLSSHLFLRGLKTLSLRMERHSSTALIIARMLEAHPEVAWVSYPFLESHRGHEVARRQMSKGSGMLAFGLHSGFEGARGMMNRLRLIARAVSLGDAETLICHPASLMRARDAVREDERHFEGGLGGLIRLSAGLEEPEDLIGDLKQALEGSA